MAVDLANAGVEKYNVRSLGTLIESIRKGEDRELFKEMLEEIGEPVPPSATATNLKEAHQVAQRLGLPLVIRPAYTLGGSGGGFVNTWKEFDEAVFTGLNASPIHQILLEKSLVGWKEIEYEVMRDSADNCITVCNMENIDPMGAYRRQHGGSPTQDAPVKNADVKNCQYENPSRWEWRGAVFNTPRPKT